MKKFKNLLLCIDIDSTLIDDSHYISQNNLEAIQYFKSNGGKVTLASGRIITTVIPVAEIINVDYPVICFNGCGIYDIEKNKFLMFETIGKDALDTAMIIGKEFPSSGIEIFSKDTIYVLKYNDTVKKHINSEKIKPVFIDSINEIDFDIAKILFAQPQTDTFKIKEFFLKNTFNGSFRPLQAHSLYYELLNISSNKGVALKKLCSKYQISPENVIAIGDNDNDIEMIKFAGTGVAVGNASEDLKKVADYIVSDNNHSAVYDLIKALDDRY